MALSNPNFGKKECAKCRGFRAPTLELTVKGVLSIKVMGDTNIATVFQIINRYIDTTYSQHRTVSENLDLAQNRAMNARRGSYDVDGRNAEYYLKARWMVSKSDNPVIKNAKALGGSGLSYVYNLGKLLYICAGLEEWARTDPDVMVSPPGGMSWVQRGAADGIEDDGKSLGKPDHANTYALWLM